MKTLNLRLEQKVVERTRELEELNSTLKEEIDERKAAETTIEFLAYHDPLTGLMNRVALKNYLTGQLADALEKNSKIALFFLDLDRFKMVNDSLGHQIGDELLKHVALRIEECLEHKGRVCRQGGDEFILAVPEFKDKEALKELAEKLIHKISENYKIEGHEFNIDTSIGISIYPEHGQDMESLIRNADIAMYTAKDLGRNNYQFYSIEMSLNVYEQLMLESRLKAALKKNEFRVFYQPKVNASTGIIEGFEALIRWIHPEFGMVSPAKFIPIAEQKGYIISIGEWVLKEACAQAKEWSEKGYNLNVAVNLSPLQFNKDSIITDISGALKASELDPGLLELEITESGIMKDADKAIRILDKLKRLGVSVSIDDFGTGYSSLSHLKKFPIQKLKIDQSFVRDIPQDKENMAITRSIVDLAKNLGLKTIAEGVETEEQSEFLKSIGCDQLQGYYFGKPQPLAAVNEILEKKKNNYK
jgi:diguanylate cyclase (GGDEF)-like protein